MDWFLAPKNFAIILILFASQIFIVHSHPDSTIPSRAFATHTHHTKNLPELEKTAGTNSNSKNKNSNNPDQDEQQNTKKPWYEQPAITGLVGALGGAFMTAIISIFVRVMTNKHEIELRNISNQHELQKMFVDRQLFVYAKFLKQINDFELLDTTKPSFAVDILNSLERIVADFAQYHPFLDKETIKAFDESISKPLNKNVFSKIIEEDGPHVLYNEVRERLTLDVIGKAEGFLNRFTIR